MPGTIKLWKTGLESTAVQKMTFQGIGNLQATEGGGIKRMCKPTKCIRKREEQKISPKKGYEGKEINLHE